MSQFSKLIKKLNIDETYTKPVRKSTIKFDSVKANTLLQPDYNYMADVLYLPKTKSGYKFLLCVVDLGTDEFDIEPMKQINSSNSLDAMKKIFGRKILLKPKASIRTDGGPEFKGEFAKYCHDNDILHRIAISGRHKQLANVDSLMVQLERLFIGYMNAKEEQTGVVFKEWDEIIDTVREELNKIRKKDSIDPFEQQIVPRVNEESNKEPKYKIGDYVYRIVDNPIDATGQTQPTKRFRVGDYRFEHTKPRKIIRVLLYPNNFRYLLEGIDGTSYTETELRPAKNPEPEFDEEGNRIYYIEKILQHKKQKNMYLRNPKLKPLLYKYKIQWKGLPKSKATWASYSDLIDDGFGPFIDNYNEINNIVINEDI
jgi:hypothetical protein